MVERFSRGSTARLYLDIGDTGESPTAAVRRESDLKWFDASDSSWQTTPVENPMTEVSVAHLPGRYSFDFDQTEDDLVGSATYTVRLTNPAPLDWVEFRDISFEALASAASPSLCAITGTLFTAAGQPLAGALVTATLLPVMTDGAGRGYENEALIRAWSREDGSFQLSVVRGAAILLEIAKIGYARKVNVPDAASVLFNAL